MTDAPSATYLSPSEVAKRLDVSETTLARWRDKGKGPPWSMLGERFRYDAAALETWLSTRKRGGEGAA